MQSLKHNDMRSLSHKIYESVIFTIAALMALATGFGYSGSILIVASLLQPSLSFIPILIYSSITNTFFGMSVITWAALRFSEMKNLFSPLDEKNQIGKLLHDSLEKSLNALIIQLQEEHAPSIDHSEKTKNFLSQKVLTHTLNYIDLNISILITRNTHQRNNDLKARYGKPDTWLSYISYWLQYISIVNLYAAIDLLLREDQLRKLQMIRKAVRNQLKNTPRENIKLAKTRSPLLKDSAAYIKESLDKLLPQTLPTNWHDLYNSFLFSCMNIITYINAFFVQSIGLALYGAFPLIAMLEIQNAAISYAILSTFGLIGFTGAISFSRPTALNAIHNLFGYSESAQNATSIKDKFKENHSYFKTKSLTQKLLAFFMASGIAIANFVANTAFGEFLFAGKSIFEIPSLISILISNPFSASTASIAFGIMAAVCTFFIAFSILLNTTLNIHLKSKKTLLHNIPNTLNNLKTFTNIAITLFCITILGILIGGHALAATLLLHIQPILIASLVLSILFINYKRCEESDTPFLINILISTTVLLNSAASAYLSGLSGSVYFVFFGPYIAIAGACMTGIANLDLGLPLFRGAKNNLNAIYNYQPFFSNIDSRLTKLEEKYPIHTPA